jgi:hypothetical protein
MKRGLVKPLLLVLVNWALVATLAGANVIPQRLESIVVESFDSPTERRWLENGAERIQQRQWIARGSRFSTEGYPRVQYAEIWPSALFGANVDGLELSSLGLWAKFDRQGYNYLEIYPAREDEEGNLVPVNMNLPGIVQTLDIWVWGNSHRYYLEAHVRDSQGVPHVLELGSLWYNGWRNLTVRVPHTIPQDNIRLFDPEAGEDIDAQYPGLRLTKFVIRTEPNERVENFFVYFDQIKILTDMHTQPFDGGDLTRPDVIRNIWSNQ